MTPLRFHHFAAIDWSGAAGERHKGIALAICGVGDAAPRIVRPGHRWSRAEIAEWLAEEMPDGTLAGLDLGMSLPHADRGEFFPAWDESPVNARDLWAAVERICAEDPHLSVSSFVDHAEASRHFRRQGGREGEHFGGGRGRFRQTELAQERMGCRPYSNFNLVGAAQVGKSSLSGMRMLHLLSPRLPVWPVDPLPDEGSVVVEIYTTIAAMHAGRPPGRSKMRSYEELNSALTSLGSQRVEARGTVDDHTSDAILTSAWLRTAAHHPELWNPPGLSEVAQTEGWTFGAV